MILFHELIEVRSLSRWMKYFFMLFCKIYCPNKIINETRSWNLHVYKTSMSRHQRRSLPLLTERLAPQSRAIRGLAVARLPVAVTVSSPALMIHSLPFLYEHVLIHQKCLFCGEQWTRYRSVSSMLIKEPNCRISVNNTVLRLITLSCSGGICLLSMLHDSPQRRFSEQFED